MKRPPEIPLWRIFRWPLAIGVAATIGLVGALLADCLWDGLGAALLALSAPAFVWAMRNRRV